MHSLLVNCLKQEVLGLPFLFITLPTLSLSGLMFSKNAFQLPVCALTELTVENCILTYLNQCCRKAPRHAEDSFYEVHFVSVNTMKSNTFGRTYSVFVRMNESLMD